MTFENYIKVEDDQEQSEEKQKQKQILLLQTMLIVLNSSKFSQHFVYTL